MSEFSSVGVSRSTLEQAAKSLAVGFEFQEVGRGVKTVKGWLDSVGNGKSPESRRLFPLVLP